MKLFGIKGRFYTVQPHTDCDSWHFHAPGFSAHIVCQPSGMWAWYIWLGAFRLDTHSSLRYTTARGARDGLVRAVKRLGVKVGGKR